MTEENKCSLCGSDRMFEVDPNHEPGAYRCMDCGSQFNRAVIKETPKDSDFRSLLAEAAPQPEGGFNTPEEAMAHLAKLKEAARKLGKTVEREDKPVKKKHPTSDYPSNMVMAEYHFFQREGENFQQVLSTAKGEREFKNENVLIWAHNHFSGRECTGSCREILSNG